MMSLAILSIAMFAAVFAPETEKNFMSACSAGTDSSVCRCTLDRIERQYTEAQFKNIDTQLSHGKKSPAYETFVQRAVADCRAQASQGSAAGAVAGLQMSPEDSATMQLMVESFAGAFVPECKESLNSFFGVAESEKTCTCFLGKIKSPETVSRLVALSVQGEAGESKMMELLWDVGSACIPEKYTAEMENQIIAQCVDDSSEVSRSFSKLVPASKATEKDCRCVLKELEKNYTFRDLVKISMTSDSSLVLYVTAAAARCAEK